MREYSTDPLRSGSFVFTCKASHMIEKQMLSLDGTVVLGRASHAVAKSQYE
jgi:hypothetical protein